jgi:NADH:ubiquinone oxidoreductase subunit 4 (subunit M)
MSLIAQAHSAVEPIVQHDVGSFFGTPLTYMVFVPLVGGLIMMLVPKTEEVAHKVIALATSLVAGGIGVYLLFNFAYDRAHDMQFAADLPWITAINSRYIVGVDGISLPLVALTLFVVPLCIIYSWNHFPEPRDPKSFLILLLILETGMIGSFIARDLILFFVFFEVVLLPMYFMIGVWGGEQRQYASIKFFLYTLFGSALMIVAFLSLYFLSAEVMLPGGGLAHTFNMELLPRAAEGITASTAILIFGGMFVGFGVKVRCSRSTRGCPTPTPRPRPSARSSWPPCSSSWAPTASCASPSRSCPRPPTPGPRPSPSWRSSASSTARSAAWRRRT